MLKHNHQSPHRYSPLKILLFIVIFFIILAAFSTVIMLLWNAILPDLIGVKRLTIWKSLGLVFLVKLLIGGIRRGTRPRDRRVIQDAKNKWMNMTTEERAAAKNRWKHYCQKKDTDQQS